MAGRILVLDDEENYAEMLRDLLRDNNYRVDMATRPERALDQLEEIPYDLVISDYKMPVMDGADFLKKSRELYPNLPFILVSGLMNTPELVKVANMSVTLVMEKPLDTDAFLKHVARFSEPMTDQEKDNLALESEDENVADAGEAVESCPSEPRFFKTLSPAGNLFMQRAWSISSRSPDLYILERKVGEAELAAKDISEWRGNGDMPVSILDLPNTLEEGLSLLRGIFEGLEQSNTVCFRLGDVSQIPMARSLTEQALLEVGGANAMLLIFAVEGTDVPAFKEKAGESCVVLPCLADRPSDLASYAQRFARIVSERTGKPNCCKFEDAAAYLLLSYDWEGGYRQVQQVIMQAVQSSEEDAPISAASLGAALSLEGRVSVAPETRMGALMEMAQRRYCEREIRDKGRSVEDLIERFELDSSVQTTEDLLNMPVINGELTKL